MSVHFALSVNDLVNCFRTKLAGDLIDLLRFIRCGLCAARSRDFRLHLAFNLRLYRFVLCGTPRLFDALTCRRLIDSSLDCRIADCQLPIAMKPI